MSEPHGDALDNEIAFPTETDIYILPDGRVVIADLPLELVMLVSTLGFTEACEAVPEEETPEHRHSALPHD